jgi:hypothetical protein
MEECCVWLWEAEEFVLVVDAVSLVGKDSESGG